ncbi:MAG: hypothetical protein O9301_06715 [Leptospira sp.]|nr:hypothetical protein [Leptospira sp.]
MSPKDWIQLYYLKMVLVFPECDLINDFWFHDESLNPESFAVSLKNSFTNEGNLAN